MNALQEIQKRAAAATPGPWQWFGNWDFREVYLATRNYGRRYVLGFRRWGMQGAQPVFRSAPGDGATLQHASEVPVFEVCRSATSRDDDRVYRGDLVGFRNADAEFIAHSRQDVDDLLAIIAAIRDRAESWIDDMEYATDESCIEGSGCPCCHARDILSLLGIERPAVRLGRGEVVTVPVAGDVL
ncbi:MAG TPA: hypothetical protein VIP06_02855 [Nocardioides sp.]